jgi:hypothetical protein
MTHDYKRHGTTDLLAALNIKTGEGTSKPTQLNPLLQTGYARLRTSSARRVPATMFASFS